VLTNGVKKKTFDARTAPWCYKVFTRVMKKKTIAFVFSAVSLSLQLLEIM